MKKILFFALSGLLLASCANEEFEGGQNALEKGNGEISFSMSTPNLTRGTTIGEEAAKKLNYNFIVYGFKNVSADEQADASADMKVFDLYNVNYEQGSANTTKSNTNNWEYVGYTSQLGKDQTIKYWDFSARQYVFSAVSGTGINVEKITEGTTVYDKGWKVIVPQGGSLNDLYASKRTIQKKYGEGGTFKYDVVNLKFFSLVTKIRFAFYETVPGYSVSIDSVFYSDGAGKRIREGNNFAIGGSFKGANPSDTTCLYVTYYDNASGIENQPKTNSNGYILPYGKFGTNLMTASEIGTASNVATFDQADRSYTCILPYQDPNNVLQLMVDYTLTSTDGSGETIRVRSAKATVPAQFTQWKNNFAYTYYFKISDNTNGTTGWPEDPEHPWPGPGPKPSDKDPEGLYPITFDACVSGEDDGIQESVTTVTTPSITTYAKGEVVSKNADYAAGDIYYTAAKGDQLLSISDSKVYEVIYNGKSELTEKLVSDYLNNTLLLTPVKTTAATSVPLADGTNMTFTSGKCYKFTAAAGKNYAIKCGDAWKLVKVTGTPAAPAFKLECAKNQSITTPDITAMVKLTNTTGTDTDKGVRGAKSLLSVWKGAEDYTKFFNVVELDSGKYTVQLTSAAVKAGADGTYTVKFNESTVADNTFKVDLHYVLRDLKTTSQLKDNKIAIVCGRDSSFKLTIGQPGEAQVVKDAVIENEYEEDSLFIIQTSAGVYQVSAAKSTLSGTKTVKIAGQTLTIEVNSFSFDVIDKFVFNFKGECSDGTLFLRKNGESLTYEVPVSQLTGIDPTIATITANGNGQYKVKPLKYGSYTVKYENAEMKIVVDQYTLKKQLDQSIKKSTGTATLILNKNGEKINATTANLKVQDGYTNPGTFNLTTNGKHIIFSNATAAGTYKFKYKIGEADVAHVEIVVTD